MTRDWSEHEKMGGRMVDPKAAPNVPLYVEINGAGGIVDVTVACWNRTHDRVHEFRFHVEGEHMGEVQARPLSSEDKTWLRNIGARVGTILC